MRSLAVRLARATGGGVEFWIGLPIAELAGYMFELIDQLEKEAQAQEKALKR